jgi:hypothetical protein
LDNNFTIQEDKTLDFEHSRFPANIKRPFLANQCRKIRSNCLRVPIRSVFREFFI